MPKYDLRPTTDRKKIARLACQLHAGITLLNRPKLDIHHHANLRQEMWDTRRNVNRLKKAQQRSWAYSSNRLAGDLRSQLSDLASSITSFTETIGTSPLTVISPRQIFSEIACLLDSEDFSNFSLHLKEKQLCVVTQRVDLEGHNLGAFQIVWNYELVLNGDSKDPSADFSVIALTPSFYNDSVTHPHVKDENPCLGDAVVPINTAIRQGRVEDAFLLVDRVLKTYNKESAYQNFGDDPDDDDEDYDDDDESESCSDCGETIDRGRNTCHACDDVICEGCSIVCVGCDLIFCVSCVKDTKNGKACESCRDVCGDCGETFLDSKLDDNGRCPSCKETYDADETAQPSESESEL